MNLPHGQQVYANLPSQPGMMPNMQNLDQMQQIDQLNNQRILNFQTDPMQSGNPIQMAPMGDFNQNQRQFREFQPKRFENNMNGDGMNFGNNKYKTSLCNNFTSAGFCKFGDNCKFAHGEDDLRSGGNQMGGFNKFSDNNRGDGYQPRGRGGFGGQRGGGFNSQRGGGFNNSRGGFGGRSGDQMNSGFGGQNMGQMQVCRYFQQNGVCKFGDTCKFIHIGDSD